jgi:plastocyanin
VRILTIFELAKGTSMQNQGSATHARISIAALIAGAMLVGIGTYAGLAASQYVVSQKGREFRPSDVTIKRGEALTIVNDDADLQHHAYIDSDKFRFDSGDQEPGSKTNINFPVEGSFDVLCAIHPKMKLVVHVK